MTEGRNGNFGKNNHRDTESTEIHRVIFLREPRCSLILRGEKTGLLNKAKHGT